MKLSVITVVYNCADRLKDTIESVACQDYGNIEYIIKDGGSDDGTIDVIKGLSSVHGFIRYESSKDKGIYDAMNMALSRATGDVVHFLNAGDRFASSDVVRKSMRCIEETNADIVFGNVLYENQDGTVDERSYPQSCARKSYYLTGDCINHQCMFMRRNLFVNNLFDTSFRICSDREWMMRIGAYSPHLKMKALGFPVVRYPLDGFSVVNKELYKREALLCIKKHMPLGLPIYSVFEFFRTNELFSRLLHRLYSVLYIKGAKH